MKHCSIPMLPQFDATAECQSRKLTGTKHSFNSDTETLDMQAVKTQRHKTIRGEAGINNIDIPKFFPGFLLPAQTRNTSGPSSHSFNMLSGISHTGACIRSDPVDILLPAQLTQPSNRCAMSLT